MLVLLEIIWFCQRNKKMNIKVKKIREDAKLPERASNQAVGYDVYASRVLDKQNKEVIGELPIKIVPGGSALIGIGVQVAIPWPYEAEVRPRSGLATRYDIELSNAPGTIDPDYRGEAGILLRNRGDKNFVIEKDMRIAQLIFSKVAIPVLEETQEDLSFTIRGYSGFGSTGFLEIKEGTKEYEMAIREKDEFFMKVVLAVSERSDCIRGVKKINDQYERDKDGKLIGQTRRFGCIIVDKEDNIISMGFNTQHKGSPLCEEVGCLREEKNIASGTILEECRANHAEQLTFLKMGVSGVGASTKGATMYVNAEPCIICAKMIADSKIETLVILEGVYPANGTDIVRQAGVNIRYVKL